MTRAIAIAAGGGGDAVTTSVIATKLSHLGVTAILTYSWDRLLIDPTPGPRTAADFDGLIDRGGVMQVPPTASLRTGGHSTIPHVAHCIPQPVLLMDIDDGAVGLIRQIVRAAELYAADEVIVIDIGGDILGEGHEAELRSPLADSLALAAAVGSGMPVRLLVAGMGLDGELTAAQLAARCTALTYQVIGALEPADVAPVAEVWSWHPSEANGLLAVAATGWRGRVETQRDAVFDITDAATEVLEIPARAAATSTLAAALASTDSLAEVEQILRDRRGYSDIDFERRRASSRSAARMPTEEALTTIDEYAVDAARRGVDALTVRRVIELSGATDALAMRALRESLSKWRPARFVPPLYLVSLVSATRLPLASQ
ncbi:DUF1152 domain-containing protein [Nocardia otitidiscaviarum]|uniref:DUF1152 domain-containing protein n=1 Tax=Nocardia otitidiscaviarum TaxID=1823 RepID=UPI00189494A2|nr:DUF1152 domain-containing protein [Nocardia otitidiscaviarum]MBF6240485.1 DUF1152 domain-containing protein [Nocardia otitidiscaviarum]